MTYILTFDLDLNKVKVKGHDLGHYPAKLLKRFRFSQNVFTFFLFNCFKEVNHVNVGRM